MEQAKKLKNIEELDNLRLLLKDDVFKEDVSRIRACCGTACMATGAAKVIRNIEASASETGQKVDIVRTGCQGLCQKGPVMKIEPFGYFFQKVNQADAKDIVTTTLATGYPVRKLLYRANFMTEPFELMETLPFYKKQLRIALRNNGRIDPNNIYHFISVGGYAALGKALFTMTPDQVLGEVDKANLRAKSGSIQKVINAKSGL